MESERKEQIVIIEGREYETVSSRVKRFIDQHPDWSIETEILELNKDFALLKTTIKDESGRIRSVGHAEEWRSSSRINSTSMVENAETSAVGRALAFLGFHHIGIASAEEIEIALRKEQALRAAVEEAKKKVLKEGISPVKTPKKKYTPPEINLRESEEGSPYTALLNFAQENAVTKDELDLFLTIYSPQDSLIKAAENPENKKRFKQMIQRKMTVADILDIKCGNTEHAWDAHFVELFVDRCGENGVSFTPSTQGGFKVNRAELADNISTIIQILKEML